MSRDARSIRLLSFVFFCLLAFPAPALPTSTFFRTIPSRNPELKEVWALAHALDRAGNHEAAITEYLRYSYFCSDSTHVAHAYEQIADCLLRDRDVSGAQEYLGKALALTVVRGEREMLRFRLAKLSLRLGRPRESQGELLRLSFQAKDRNVRRRASLLQAYSDVELHQWDLARQALKRYRGMIATDTPSLALVGRLDSLLTHARRGRKSPRRARVLSTFVPGLGQVYSGHMKEGLNAFTLNGVLGYYLASAIHSWNPSDVVLAFSFFRRYYVGNRYHAARLATESNRLAEDKTVVSVTVLLQRLLKREDVSLGS